MSAPTASRAFKASRPGVPHASDNLNSPSHDIGPCKDTSVSMPPSKACELWWPKFEDPCIVMHKPDRMRRSRVRRTTPGGEPCRIQCQKPPASVGSRETQNNSGHSAENDNSSHDNKQNGHGDTDNNLYKYDHTYCRSHSRCSHNPELSHSSSRAVSHTYAGRQALRRMQALQLRPGRQMAGRLEPLPGDVPETGTAHLQAEPKKHAIIPVLGMVRIAAITQEDDKQNMQLQHEVRCEFFGAYQERLGVRGNEKGHIHVCIWSPPKIHMRLRCDVVNTVFCIQLCLVRNRKHCNLQYFLLFGLHSNCISYVLVLFLRSQNLEPDSGFKILCLLYAYTYTYIFSFTYTYTYALIFTSAYTYTYKRDSNGVRR